jgi:mono/diheme cytochrome c family protein
MVPSRRTTVAALATIAAVVASVGLAACGTEDISVPENSPDYRGAELFAQRCAGCHTLSPAGTQGSANRAVRVEGPNLDQRKESYDDVLFAIRNGGFTGAIMPANVVTGDEATAVARFVSKYAGTKAQETPTPGAAPTTSATPGAGPTPGSQ